MGCLCRQLLIMMYVRISRAFLEVQSLDDNLRLLMYSSGAPNKLMTIGYSVEVEFSR